MIIIWSVIAALITIILLISGIINSLGAALLSLVICFFALLLIWAVPCIVATLFVDTGKENKKDSRFFRFYAYSIINILQFVLRYKVNMSGFDKIPEETFLMISNHRSAFDPIIQLGVFRKYNLSFVAKKEVISIPIIGKIMYRCSAVGLDRGDIRQATKAILQTASIIKSGIASMGIYPEGTRNSDEGLLPFKPGAFKIAQKAKCPIVVAIIENSEFVMKNTPFKKTEVNIKIVDVLQPQFINEQTTVKLGEITSNMMMEALGSLKQSWKGRRKE